MQAKPYGNAATSSRCPLFHLIFAFFFSSFSSSFERKQNKKSSSASIHWSQLRIFEGKRLTMASSAEMLCVWPSRVCVYRSASELTGTRLPSAADKLCACSGKHFCFVFVWFIFKQIYCFAASPATHWSCEPSHLCGALCRSPSVTRSLSLPPTCSSSPWFRFHTDPLRYQAFPVHV